MGYWCEKLDRLPPHVCRILAREPHKRKTPLSTKQISKRSGLSVQTVRRVSKLTSWKDVTVGTMEKFKEGCGITVGRECLQTAYIKRSHQTAAMPFFHIHRLRRMRKDKRRDNYLSNLMTAGLVEK